LQLLRKRLQSLCACHARKWKARVQITKLCFRSSVYVTNLQNKRSKKKKKEAGARPTGIFAFQGPPTPKPIRRAKKSDQAGRRKKRKSAARSPPCLVVPGSSLGIVVVLSVSYVLFCPLPILLPHLSTEKKKLRKKKRGQRVLVGDQSIWIPLASLLPDSSFDATGLFQSAQAGMRSWESPLISPIFRVVRTRCLKCPKTRRACLLSVSKNRARCL
jgi:hypothetical protein